MQYTVTIVVLTLLLTACGSSNVEKSLNIQLAGATRQMVIDEIIKRKYDGYIDCDKAEGIRIVAALPDAFNSADKWVIRTEDYIIEIKFSDVGLVANIDVQRNYK